MNTEAKNKKEIEIVSIVGTNIRKLRLNRGFSQSDLADLCCTSKSQIARIENGETSCTLTTLAKITEGLEIDFRNLFDITFIQQKKGPE